jgi:hypothetical protein
MYIVGGDPEVAASGATKRTTGVEARHSSRRIVVLVLMLTEGCGLFGPRDPEPPNQSSLNFLPPTEPSIVVTNLVSAIDQKNVQNYVSCFSDPSKGGRPYVFIPSAEGSSQYGSALNGWTVAQEQSYFQNLVAKSPSSAFSSLALSSKDSLVTSDSVVYGYHYVFTFEHSDPGFPKISQGNLQFTIAPDKNNFWSISRWADFKTGTDITWSSFKGKFSN